MSRGMIKTGSVDSNNSQMPSRSLWIDTIRRLRRDKFAVAGLIVFVLICLACVMAPLLTQWEYTTINPHNTLAVPSFEHILGTDSFGRDMFSRFLYGGRTTLSIALATTVMAAVAGGVIGLMTGYFGGKADYLVTPALDTLASIPIVLLIIVLESVFGFGRGYFMYAMVIAAIPQFARLVRAGVLDITGFEYIEAARALGVADITIITRHVLHNIASPLIVRLTSGVAEAILMCTIMGYLGVGIKPPIPEWGGMVNSAKAYVFLYPRMVIIPCVIIALSVISLSIFGDGLRNALNPKR